MWKQRNVFHRRFLADIAFTLFIVFILNMKVRSICMQLEIIQHKEKLNHGGERKGHCRGKVLEQMIGCEIQGNK